MSGIALDRAPRPDAGGVGWRTPSPGSTNALLTHREVTVHTYLTWAAVGLLDS